MASINSIVPKVYGSTSSGAVSVTRLSITGRGRVLGWGSRSDDGYNLFIDGVKVNNVDGQMGSANHVYFSFKNSVELQTKNGYMELIYQLD